MSAHAVAWNMRVGRHPGIVRDELTRLIRRNHRPDVVALQECSTYQREIEQVRRAFGYRRPITGAGPPGSEGPSTVLLIHKRVPLRRRRLLVLLLTWIGPRTRRRRPGRRLPLAVVKLAGVWIRVVDVHGNPGRKMPANTPAWRELLRRLERVAANPRAALLFLGDWNCRVGEDDPDSVQVLAHRIGAQIIPTGAPIDYAIARGVTVTGARGPAYGSNHRSTIYAIRKATR